MKASPFVNEGRCFCVQGKEKIMKNKNVLKLTYAGLCLALCLVLPFLTGQIPQIGSKLLPMHIPVLLCGPVWGLGVGLIAPLLRSLLFGMPPLFPTATAMAFELAAYGLLSGLFYKLLPKKLPYLYLSLILAMIGGRLVWGLAQIILMGIAGKSFTLAAFWAGAFANAWPGIILQIVLIPPVIAALQKAKLMLNE